jgi:hypothetical protein
MTSRVEPTTLSARRIAVAKRITCGPYLGSDPSLYTVYLDGRPQVAGIRKAGIPYRRPVAAAALKQRPDEAC